MTKDRCEDSPPPSAEEIYAEYKRRILAGEKITFDSLCRRYPRLATALRLLRDLEETPEEDPSGISEFSHKLEEALTADLPPLEAEVPKGAGLEKAVYQTRDGLRFEVRRVLARSSLSVVLEVYEETLDRTLAMKVLIADREEAEKSGSYAGPTRTERFLQEAHVLGRLHVPGILPIHHFGVDTEGQLFFTMPLVDGEGLGDVFRAVRERRDGWDLRRALTVLVRLCRILAEVHAKGIIHRDLKPANILVGDMDQVFVLDWGLARNVGVGKTPGQVLEKTTEAERPESSGGGRAERETRAITPTTSMRTTLAGTVVGTPPYTAPEQAAGRTGVTDQVSDIYSVGAILYELLAGVPPHMDSDAEITPETIIDRIASGPPERVRKLNPKVSPELAAIAEKAMARRKADRYPTFTAMGDDIEAFLKGKVVKAYETGFFPEVRKWVQRNRRPAVSVAALSLAFVTGIILLILSEKKASHLAGDLTTARSQARLNGRAAERARSERLDILKRLSDIHTLHELKEEFDRQGLKRFSNPCLLDDWLKRARGLIERLPEHRRALEELRRRGQSRPALTLDSYPHYHPFSAAIRSLAKKQNQARILLSLMQSESLAHNPFPVKYEPELLRTQRERTKTRISACRAKSEALINRVITFIDCTFSTREYRALYEEEIRYIAEMEIFQSEWPIPGLYPRLKTLRERIARGFAKATISWSEASAAIADRKSNPQYDGYHLRNHDFLCPLGPNLRTGLWEFAFLPSGELPRRGPDGEFAIDDDTCIIFVLIPAYPMRFRNGKKTIRTDRNRTPFLLSKYEMTKGQWLRLGGTEDDFFPRGLKVAGRTITARDPVEGVSMTDASIFLVKSCLWLPRMRQWDWAFLAGRSPAEIFEDPRKTLAGHANLRDRTCREYGNFGFKDVDEWLDDGYPFYAPVGSFKPNPYGLYDMIGNVWEMCRGPKSTFEYITTKRREDSVYCRFFFADIAIRGGSFLDRARTADTRKYRLVRRTDKAASIGIRPIMWGL